MDRGGEGVGEEGGRGGEEVAHLPCMARQINMLPRQHTGMSGV